MANVQSAESDREQAMKLGEMRGEALAPNKEGNPVSIKRFGFKYIGGGDTEWEGEQPNGEYCHYSDYEDASLALTASEARVKAAETISRIYFEIAAEVVGEDKARAMFSERFEQVRALGDVTATKGEAK